MNRNGVRNKERRPLWIGVIDLKRSAPRWRRMPPSRCEPRRWAVSGDLRPDPRCLW